MTNNKLLNYSKPLLCFLAELHLNNHLDKLSDKQLKSIQGILINEINILSDKLKHSKFNRLTQASTLYCLVAAIDELVIHQLQNRGNLWSSQSILSLIYNDTWGGERFFIIMNYALKYTYQYKELTELLYLLLCFGYQGKFNLQDIKFINLIKKQLSKNINHYTLKEKQIEFMITKSKRFNETEIKKIMKISLISLLMSSLSSLFIFNLLLGKLI